MKNKVWLQTPLLGLSGNENLRVRRENGSQPCESGCGQMGLRDTPPPPPAQMGKLRPGAAPDAALAPLPLAGGKPAFLTPSGCLWACILLLTSTRSAFQEAIAEGVMAGREHQDRGPG